MNGPTVPQLLFTYGMLSLTVLASVIGTFAIIKFDERPRHKKKT